MLSLNLRQIQWIWDLCLHYFKGGYISGSNPPQIIREAILRLCYELKDDSVSLADAVAPTDFVLNSPIGQSDGEVMIYCLFIFLLAIFRLNWMYYKRGSCGHDCMIVIPLLDKSRGYIGVRSSVHHTFGFRIIIKVPLNQIFSNFHTLLCTIKYRLNVITVYFTFTVHQLWPFFS